MYNKYDNMTRRELWVAAMNVRKGKEARQLHRALKKFDPKDGLFFLDRYPNLPLIISIASLLLVLLEPVLRGILLRMQIWQGM